MTIKEKETKTSLRRRINNTQWRGSAAKQRLMTLCLRPATPHTSLAFREGTISLAFGGHS